MLRYLCIVSLYTPLVRKKVCHIICRPLSKKCSTLGLKKKQTNIYIYICAFVIATVVVHGIANDMLFQDTPNITFITS